MFEPDRPHHPGWAAMYKEAFEKYAKLLVTRMHFLKTEKTSYRWFDD